MRNLTDLTGSRKVGSGWEVEQRLSSEQLLGKIKPFHVYSSMKGDFSIKQAPVVISEIGYKTDKLSLISMPNVYPYDYTHVHPCAHTYTPRRRGLGAGNTPTYVLVLLAEPRTC